jgi:radical SAM protein
MQLETVGTTYPGHLYRRQPRNVYWETTVACGLACQHCRAHAMPDPDPAQLTTAEGKALMDSVKELGSMLVLTGGDPLERPDLPELIEYGRSLPISLSITPSTTPRLTREKVGRFKELGITAMGVSLDGPTAEHHDAFRAVPGTFAHSMNALTWAAEERVKVQVNTTVTAKTLPHLPEIYALLRDRFAPPVRRWSLFLLVPMGRGESLGVPTAQQVEELFEWVYDIGEEAPFRVGTTEAPHYRRYWIQRQLAGGTPLAAVQQRARAMSFGIRDGNGVVFVSHTGDVYPAGFLPEPKLGNVRDTPLDRIYRESEALQQLQNPDNYTGRCGQCAFRYACGGSRARAWAMTGDPLGDDPLCAFDPASMS